jgi:hypothetical protein
VRGLLVDETTSRLVGLTGWGRPLPVTMLSDVAPSAGYRPSTLVDTVVRLRDRTCRAPVCQRSALACDLDHVEPWPEGTTDPDHMVALCRRHHRLKTHAAGWQMTREDDGSVRWTGPSGAEVRVPPSDYAPPF